MTELQYYLKFGPTVRMQVKVRTNWLQGTNRG